MLAGAPDLFSRLLAINAGEAPLWSLGPADALRAGAGLFSPGRPGPMHPGPHGHPESLSATRQFDRGDADGPLPCAATPGPGTHTSTCERETT